MTLVNPEDDDHSFVLPVFAVALPHISEGQRMKTAVIGIGNGASMDAIMAVYPRHKAVVDAFIGRGELIGIGPFADRSGSLAIFRSREAAEAFVKEDPFLLEGVIGSYDIHEWGDQLIE